MTRLLGLLLGALVLLVGVAPAVAQTDLTIQNFPCLPPNQTTDCVRVHTDTTSTTARMDMTITGGNINAAGGYKVAFVFAHPNYAVVNSSLTQIPIAGAGPATINATGPLYQRVGYAGSIIAVAISSNTAITAGAAHVEAVRYDGTNIVPTQLRARISAAGGGEQTQYNVSTQARGVHIFTSSESVGCRLQTSSAMTPTNAMIACTVTTVH